MGREGDGRPTEGPRTLSHWRTAAVFGARLRCDRVVDARARRSGTRAPSLATLTIAPRVRRRARAILG